MTNQEIYNLACNKDYSLHERAAQLTAYFLPLKSQKMKANPNVVFRHIKAIENTTGLLLLCDAKSEMTFFEAFFKQLFLNYPHIESFGWEQREDFNDSYYYYNVSNFKLNGNNLYIFTGLDGFDFLKRDPFYPDSWMRDLIWDSLYYEKATDQDIEDFWINGKITDEILLVLFNTHFGDAVDTVLLLFQSLYNAFTTDYFIGLFGWQSKLLISREGFYITE